MLNKVSYPLRLGDRTIFVGNQDRFQIQDFFTELRNSCRQCIVLTAENFDLCLKICEPLLLSLTTFQGSDSEIVLMIEKE